MKSISKSTALPRVRHGEEDDEEETPEITATLIRRSHCQYSSTMYLTCMKTTSLVLKISPGTQNRSVVLTVASTGKICGNARVMRRPVTAKSS